MKLSTQKRSRASIDVRSKNNADENNIQDNTDVPDTLDCSQTPAECSGAEKSVHIPESMDLMTENLETMGKKIYYIILVYVYIYII